MSADNKDQEPNGSPTSSNVDAIPFWLKPRNMAIAIVLLLIVVGAMRRKSQSEPQIQTQIAKIANVEKTKKLTPNEPAPVSHTVEEIETDTLVVAKMNAEVNETQQETSSESELEIALSKPTEDDSEKASLDTPKDVTVAAIRQRSQEVLGMTQQFVEKKEQEYHLQIETRLSKFNEKIDEAKKQAQNLSTEAKKRVSGEVETVYSNLSSAQEKLSELESSNNLALEELQKSLDGILVEVSQLLESGETESS